MKGSDIPPKVGRDFFDFTDITRSRSKIFDQGLIDVDEIIAITHKSIQMGGDEHNVYVYLSSGESLMLELSTHALTDLRNRLTKYGSD